MARDRFDELERIYDLMVLGGYAPTSLPTNHYARRYFEWRSNPENRQTGPRDATSRPGRLITVYVSPFGRAVAADEATSVPASERAINQANGIGALTPFYDTTAPSTVNSGFGFVPAKCTFANITGGVSTTSEITGNRYLDKTGSSYTVPIGQPVGGDTEFDVQDTILTDAAMANYQVSFKAEKLYRG